MHSGSDEPAWKRARPWITRTGGLVSICLLKPGRASWGGGSLLIPFKLDSRAGIQIEVNPGFPILFWLNLRPHHLKGPIDHGGIVIVSCDTFDTL